MLFNRALPRQTATLGLVLYIWTSAISSPAFCQATAGTSEIWFGWIDTPKQQLRTIVRLQRDTLGNATSGVIVSPDQTPDELPLSDIQIDTKGAWQFNVVNPVDAKRNSKYSGIQKKTDQVTGDFEQVGEKIPLMMNKFDSLPPETRENLGADAVWLGTLDLVVRKMDFRIRVYSKPPYATEDTPRLFFDSLSQNAVGIPAQFKIENGATTFEMKSIGAKFVGKMNEAGNKLDGRFIQGPLPLPLVMKLQQTAESIDALKKENKPMPPSANPEEIGRAHV